LIANLRDMMPVRFLRSASVGKILGTGSALVKNDALQKEVMSQFELPFVLRPGGDAAAGAAKAIAEHP
jgi:sedoheptulokinase